MPQIKKEREIYKSFRNIPSPKSVLSTYVDKYLEIEPVWDWRVGVG